MGRSPLARLREFHRVTLYRALEAWQEHHPGYAIQFFEVLIFVKRLTTVHRSNQPHVCSASLFPEWHKILGSMSISVVPEIQPIMIGVGLTW